MESRKKERKEKKPVLYPPLSQRQHGELRVLEELVSKALAGVYGLAIESVTGVAPVVKPTTRGLSAVR